MSDLLPAATAPQNYPKQNGRGEDDLEAQADELREVVTRGEGVGLHRVEHEVRHGVDEIGDERDLQEAPIEQGRGESQEHAKGEVQLTHVPYQVLVVRAQG